MGYPNKVIARRLDIGEATVKVHVKAILRKLNVQNRTQAAICAVNHGVQAAMPEIKVRAPVAAIEAASKPADTCDTGAPRPFMLAETRPVEHAVKA
tara:strand:- start:261 stop:548 length:288 start_codon:yes stop_codon:yes gene_type:complete